MDSTQRLALYHSSLEQAVTRNEEIVSFDDPASGKFLQFAILASEKTLVVDIPMNNLSSQENQWLGQHMEIMTDTDGQPLSYQKLFSTVQLDYAAQYTEWIFTKIFLLPDSFNVTAKVFT